MEPEPPSSADEAVDAASDMSFPASDPPSHNQPTLGSGARGTAEGEPSSGQAASASANKQARDLE